MCRQHWHRLLRAMTYDSRDRPSQASGRIFSREFSGRNWMGARRLPAGGSGARAARRCQERYNTEPRTDSRQ